MSHYETTDIFKGAFFLSNGSNLSGISFNDRQIATFTLTGKNLHKARSGLPHRKSPGESCTPERIPEPPARSFV